MTRPTTSEYAPYFSRYIDQVAGDDLLVTLPPQSERTLAFLRGISEAESQWRPSPERWSWKQALNHLNDTERIFTYRALRIARGDETPLPGFEQDVFAKHVEADRFAWEDLVDEYEAVRAASLILMRGMRPDDFLRLGVASGHPLSARAACYLVAGHELHHLKIFASDYLL